MVPVNKELLTGRVPVNKESLTGTVPVNNLFLKVIPEPEPLHNYLPLAITYITHPMTVATWIRENTFCNIISIPNIFGFLKMNNY